MRPFPNYTTEPNRPAAIHDLRKFLVGLAGGILFGLACLAAALAPGHEAKGRSFCRAESPEPL